MNKKPKGKFQRVKTCINKSTPHLERKRRKKKKGTTVLSEKENKAM